MSGHGTNRTSRNVCRSVAIRGKADIEQAALKKLDLGAYAYMSDPPLGRNTPFRPARADI
jgi:hypothetical protein